MTPPKPITIGGITFSPAPLFAEKPYKIDLIPDKKLQSLLAHNVDTLITYARHSAKKPTPTKRVAFSLVLFDKDGKHRYAGVHDDDLCYSASMLKVGVMYAAYEYRAAANRFLQSNTIADEPDFFRKFTLQLDTEVKKLKPSSLRDLPLPGLPDYASTVNYIAGTPARIDFTQALSDNIEAMIVPSHNPPTADVVGALGYPYINAALAAAGLSEIGKSGKRNVVWISSDFWKGKFVRYLPTINDGLGSAVATTRGMSRLVALIYAGGMTDSAPGIQLSGKDWTQPDRGRMQELLYRASVRHPATDFDDPYITRDFTDPPFKVESNKLGNGPLGPDPTLTGGHDNPELDVQSEVSFLTWTGDQSSTTDMDATKAVLAAKKLTGGIVVCWQNYRGLYAGGSPKPITQIVVDTVKSYLAA